MSGRFRVYGLAAGGIGFGLVVFAVVSFVAAHLVGGVEGGLSDRAPESTVVYPNL